MKKILLIAVCFVFCFSLCACGSDKSSNTGAENLDVGITDLDNEVFQEEGVGEGENPMDMYPTYTILEYLTSSDNEPMILYSTNDSSIAKDSEIDEFYVIKDGKCRKYDYVVTDYYDFPEHSDITLGQLSKMTDEEILEMLDESYRERCTETVNAWCEEGFRPEIESGIIKVSQPDYYDITSFLITDDTGNTVVEEMLMLPEVGVGGEECVMYCPDGDSEYDTLDYYNGNPDYSPIEGAIPFSKVYFNTGWGDVSDVNEITDIFCLSKEMVTIGTVYSSQYYGWITKDSEWADDYSNLLLFRDENAFVLDIYMDDMSSDEIDYIDPTTKDMLGASRKYYDEYYDNFEAIELD